MKVSTILFSVLFAGFLSIVHQAKSEQVNQSPAGRWQSVDYVEKTENFKPGQKSWRHELFVEEVEFRGDGTTSMFFNWENGWILHQDGKTKARFYIRQMGDDTYLFLPWLSGDVTERGRKPWYYVLKKISGTEKHNDGSQASAGPSESGIPAGSGRGAFRPIESVNSVKEFDDVRDKDLSKISPAEVAAIIATLDFNKDTIWPEKNLPPGKRPEKLLENAMNPGLGVRQLHKQGITGKGVSVAIIDQALYQDHPEFAGKVVAYHDLAAGEKSSMHGPAVASLLVGNNCGIAPDAKIYYVAARSGVHEVDYAEGLDWIIEQNSKLPESEKIRVVSVSAAPGIAGTPSAANQKKWNDAVTRAEAAGILVLDCTNYHGFIWRCFLDAAGRENPSQCSSDIRPGQKFDSRNDILFAPSGPRTTAEQYQKGRFTYQYNARGGQSWAIPYVAGVLAMGWQLNPQLGPGQMKEMLFKSAANGQNGEKIINPRRFIAMVKMEKSDTVGSTPRRELQQRPDRTTDLRRQRRSAR